MSYSAGQLSVGFALSLILTSVLATMLRLLNPLKEADCFR